MVDLAKETWFVGAQNDGLVIIDGPPSPAPYDGPIPKAHGPSVIATPNWRHPDCERIARLIAAAPELLAALEHILGGALSLPRFAEQEARAAISKATSRKPEGERCARQTTDREDGK